MPAVKNVGEPCAGEPHARFEVAAGGNQTSRASTAARSGASRRPYSNGRAPGVSGGAGTSGWAWRIGLAEGPVPELRRSP